MTGRIAAVAAALVCAMTVSPAWAQCDPCNIAACRAAGREARNAATRLTALDRQASCCEWNAGQMEARRLSRETLVVGAVKDQYGDPMYASAGPRAYADSATYNGPAYTASFDRPYVKVGTDTRDRTYYRGGPRITGFAARTDAILGAGATQTYLQSGMANSPGSVNPSASRSPMFNH